MFKWVKWVMPARKYLVTEVQPENYGKIFEYAIKSLIPELGLKLAGAVCDFTEPAIGQNKLFSRWSERIIADQPTVTSKED